MTRGTARHGRLPRDVHARERLRAAQQREAEALAQVCAAAAALGKASAKRDAAVAAATATVEAAQAAVTAAQVRLVEVSGLARTAQLLGLDQAQLRRALNGRRSDA